MINHIWFHPGWEATGLIFISGNGLRPPEPRMRLDKGAHAPEPGGRCYLTYASRQALYNKSFYAALRGSNSAGSSLPSPRRSKQCCISSIST